MPLVEDLSESDTFKDMAFPSMIRVIHRILLVFTRGNTVHQDYDDLIIYPKVQQSYGLLRVTKKSGRIESYLESLLL